jgi:hypothetical protein
MFSLGVPSRRDPPISPGSPARGNRAVLVKFRRVRRTCVINAYTVDCDCTGI